MSPRYEYGGDEYLLVVIEEAMSLEVNLRTMSTVAAIEAAALEGVREVCPGNASYLVHYDPDAVRVEELVERLRELEGSSFEEELIPSRLVRIPVWFDDPFTRENKERYADRHPEPGIGDLEYTARLNGMSAEQLVEAYCAAPWWVTMVGFTPGTIFGLQMVPSEKMIQAPKWRTPRPQTRDRTLAHGGAFCGIDPVEEPSGYQMLGRTPVPIFDPDRELPGLDSVVLARPGDRWTYAPIDGGRYRQIREEVKARTYRYEIVEQQFSPARYAEEGARYLEALSEEGQDALG